MVVIVIQLSVQCYMYVPNWQLCSHSPSIDDVISFYGNSAFDGISANCSFYSTHSIFPNIAVIDKLLYTHVVTYFDT